MRYVRRRLGGEAPIRVVNFDWHGNMGRLTEEKAVEGFWSLMEPFVKQVRFMCWYGGLLWRQARLACIFAWCGHELCLRHASAEKRSGS